jgi:hypothetical protein
MARIRDDTTAERPSRVREVSEVPSPPVVPSHAVEAVSLQVVEVVSFHVVSSRPLARANCAALQRAHEREPDSQGNGEQQYE